MVGREGWGAGRQHGRHTETVCELLVLEQKTCEQAALLRWF
jgi:hypothetical protein